MVQRAVGTHVHVSDDPVRNLGVLLDNSLSMSSQVNRVVQSSCLHLTNIGKVRNKLTESSTKLLVQSLVISRLDYGNSLLCGLAINLMTKLQLVQNKAARLVTLTKKRDHITPVLCISPQDSCDHLPTSCCKYRRLGQSDMEIMHFLHMHRTCGTCYHNIFDNLTLSLVLNLA